MGYLRVNITNIVSPNPFKVSFKSIVGDDSAYGGFTVTTGYTYYHNGTDYSTYSSCPSYPAGTTSIEISSNELDFNSNCWVKIEDTVTKTLLSDGTEIPRYIIENIYLHDPIAYQSCCPQPEALTAVCYHDCFPPFALTASCISDATPTPTSTPTPTPTNTPCDLNISSTITTNPTNQEGTNGTAMITFTTSNGPSTYTLNGVSQGSCTSPFTITGLSSNVEYTVIITDSNSCTHQTVFTLGQTSFTFDADYIMVTYEFVDGSDLDTRTRIASPNVGQDTQNEYLGWSVQPQWPTSGTPYLTWGGDNTGTGFESVLVNLNVFSDSYPSTTEILMDMRGFWYGSVGVQLVNVAATLWKGGTPIQSGYIWTNSTATNTYNIDSVGKVVTSVGAPVKATSSGERIATFTYNLVTGDGILDNNDIETPTV